MPESDVDFFERVRRRRWRSGWRFGMVDECTDAVRLLSLYRLVSESLNHTVDDALLNLQSSKPFRIFEFAVQL